MTQPASDSTTRSRLLDAARELLTERGFSGVTTRAIADRAGVNNALVHYHFGSKTALLTEAALAELSDEIDTPVRLLREAPSVGAGAAAAIEWIGELDVTEPRVRLLVELTIEALRDPSVRPVIGQTLEAVRADLAGVLAARGDVDDTLAGPLAAVLTALFDGVMLHRLVDSDLDVKPWAAAAEVVGPVKSQRRRFR